MNKLPMSAKQLTPFTQQAVRIIGAIPSGRVSSYGVIAKAAGSPRAARQVVRILHAMSVTHHLPWHRVVNKSGCISLQGSAFEEQRFRLQQEGVAVDENGRVMSFSKLLWEPV